MKFLQLFFLCFLIILLACNDIADDPNYYEYKETWCQDSWGSLSAFNDIEFSDSINNFLIDKSIFIERINVRFDSSYCSLCAACNCTTGRLVYVLAKDQYSSELQELGFMKLVEE